MSASLALQRSPSLPVPDSDSLYHRLFSIPCMVEMLVREFVPQTLAAGLDFSRLQRVNAKFHTRRGSVQRREGDVIWRLPTRDGTDLYLLFEFQSKIDWWMAVRAQIYQGLLGEVSLWFRRHPDQERLRQLFAELVRQAYKEHGEKPPPCYDWLEIKMKSNFPTIVKNLTQQARAEAKAEDLVHLLRARFGALAPSLRTRIQRAELPTLERWFIRAIAASDLRSVFNSPRRAGMARSGGK